MLMNTHRAKQHEESHDGVTYQHHVNLEGLSGVQYQVITLTLYPPARVDDETGLAGCGEGKNTHMTRINRLQHQPQQGLAYMHDSPKTEGGVYEATSTRSPMSMVSHRLRTDRANRSTSFLYSCKHVTVCEHEFCDARQGNSKVRIPQSSWWA